MIKFLIKNKTYHISTDYKLSGDIDSLNLEDLDYLNFIKKNNGGYFFDNSLHIYGVSKEFPFHDLVYMNNLYKEKYKDIVKDLIFFAEDIFGNPFAFLGKQICLFNLESGKVEIISNNFYSWIVELNKNLNYLSGYYFINKLNKDQIIALSSGKRLCPKIPFVLGGDYVIGNLLLKSFEENISFCASIAIQIYNLPDGTKIKFEME